MYLYFGILENNRKGVFKNTVLHFPTSKLDHWPWMLSESRKTRAAATVASYRALSSPNLFCCFSSMSICSKRPAVNLSCWGHMLAKTMT